MNAWVHYIADEKSVSSIFVKDIQDTNEAIHKARKKNRKLDSHLNNGHRIYGITKISKKKNYG